MVEQVIGKRVRLQLTNGENLQGKVQSEDDERIVLTLDSGDIRAVHRPAIKKLSVIKE